MIDEETRRTLDLLKSYVGNSAGLYLLNEMKKLGLTSSIGTLNNKERAMLAESILSNIFSNLVSPQKLGFIKSKLYRILNLNKQIRGFDKILKTNWAK